MNKEETFICIGCKKELKLDMEDWGNMCFKCADIYHDVMCESAEELK